ncbi:hypothetical protein MPER_06383, partial [Moniliophthora perniciosa FA553]
ATFDFSHESLYLTVPAGKSIALNHTVSSVYDFSSFAPGTKFTISPREESTIHESVDDAAPLKVKSNTVEVTVESDLAFNHLFTPVESDGLERRVSTPRCSDGSKLQLLVDSLKYARSLAGGAATDIRSHPTGPEYTRFFGGNNQNDIWFNFDRGRWRSEYQPRIFTCDLFVQAGTTPSICQGDFDSTMSSRGGIILHELAHAVPRS